jgi:hypothetical protein
MFKISDSNKLDIDEINKYYNKMIFKRVKYEIDYAYYTRDKYHPHINHPNDALCRSANCIFKNENAMVLCEVCKKDKERNETYERINILRYKINRATSRILKLETVKAVINFEAT